MLFLVGEHDDQMLVKCCAIIYDAVTTLIQHWVSRSTCRFLPAKTKLLANAILLMNHTLNIIGSLEGTLQYYYHATPGEPLQGSPWVTW